MEIIEIEKQSEDDFFDDITQQNETLKKIIEKTKDTSEKKTENEEIDIDEALKKFEIEE